MPNTTTVVIGAGHCGLAMSRCLADAFDRPRRARTRRGGELVAHPAVGLAAAAHPELDDPAAGLRLPGRRPGRLPRRAAGGRGSSTTTPTESRGAGADRHHGHRGAASRLRVRGGDRPGHLARADGRARRGRGHVARGAAAAGRAGAGRDHLGHRGGLPQPRPTAGRAACWWSAPRPAVSRSPTSCTAPAGRSRSPSASTSGCRGPTGAATSCGGWTPPACSTSATTRSPTWSGRATCRRCSWSAHRGARRSTSTRCARPGCGWSAGWPGSGTGWR